jgi:hypothetical protein
VHFQLNAAILVIFRELVVAKIERNFSIIVIIVTVHVFMKQIKKNIFDAYEIPHQYLEHSLYLADDTLVHRAEGADVPVRQEVVPQQGRVNQNLQTKKGSFYSPQRTIEWFETVHAPQSDTLAIRQYK